MRCFMLSSERADVFRISPRTVELGTPALAFGEDTLDTRDHHASSHVPHTGMIMRTGLQLPKVAGSALFGYAHHCLRPAVGTDPQLVRRPKYADHRPIERDGQMH